MKTKLALAIKREMIKAIHAGIPGWADEPEEQKEMLNKYKHYGDQVSGHKSVHSYCNSCLHLPLTVPYLR